VEHSNQNKNIMKNIQEKKLGRGLSALLGDGSRLKNNNLTNEKQEGEVVMLPITSIIAGIYQPRKHFDQKQLDELSNSISENGIIQPIIVRKAEGGTFEIIAGERRFKASKISGLNRIPAIIKNINNVQALEFAIIENVQRADLSVIEEAQGYRQLIIEFEYTQDQVAKKIGCSRSHIANILRLLSLPQEAQELLEQGEISFGHAKLIMNSDDTSAIARQIVANNWSVRELEIFLRDENYQEEADNDKTPVIKNKKSSSKKKGNQAQKIENKMKKLFPENLVKADFNLSKEKGKITIFFKDLKEMEDLVESF
jgi:ParB family chromosome partitioning protein